MGIVLQSCDAMARLDVGTLGFPLAQEMGIMQQAFAYPFMYWVGMNTPPDTDPAAVAEFSQFYSTVHVPEVVASNPGFVRGTRYEILQPDPRGDYGPRWLAVYDMDGEAALAASRFQPLPITAAHALAAERLPCHHDDPFDRMLIAQSQHAQLTVVTHDPKFRLYDVAILWT
jgi:hypothetical protein